MRNKSRFISLCAVLCAFSVVMLYIASVIPSGQIGFIALASLFGISAIIETGIKGGIGVFVATSILALLIIPSKTSVLFYALFFGNYPIIKSLAEQAKSRITEWSIKLIIANAELAVFLLFFKELFFEFISFSQSFIIVFLLFNIVFVVFDFGVSKAIGFYIEKISKRIKK